MCGGGVLGLFFLVRTILNSKMYRNSDSHCQLRVTVRIPLGLAQHMPFPRHLAALWCAQCVVCARARDYNTTPHNTTVTKFTFHDLT